MAGRFIHMTAKERAAQNARVAEAKWGRETAKDDSARGQTPVGRIKADKLLGIPEGTT